MCMFMTSADLVSTFGRETKERQRQDPEKGASRPRGVLDAATATKPFFIRLRGFKSV